jgi:leader peptidase (prepilin peptidase)/N-methyltransferase
MLAMWWLGAASSVAYGLVIGSFLAVCIDRLPEDRSLLAPSACTNCHSPLRWRDNVPVFSYLWLRGRCRDCGVVIPVFHPLTEALTGVLALLLFRRIFADPGDLDGPHAALWVTRLGFVSAMIVAAAVDVKHRIIPDEVSIYAVPVGVLAAVALQYAGIEGWWLVPWRSAVLGAGIWGGAFGAISFLGEFAFGQPVLGWGDVKLAAMIGAFLGVFPGMFGVVFLASVSGSVVGLGATVWYRRRLYLPFGPPLAGAAVAWAIWGDVVMQAVFPGFVAAGY